MAKTDARVIENEARIRKAYFELVKELPLNRITVTQLCDTAEINRGTFYNHYIDIYDLSEKIENETLEKFKQMVEENLKEKDGRRNVIANILEKAKRSAYTDIMIHANASNDTFLKRLSDECSRIFLNMDRYPDSSMTENEKNAYYHYMSGGSAAIIRYWFETGMAETPEQIADYIIKLTENTMCMLIGGES